MDQNDNEKQMKDTEQSESQPKPKPQERCCQPLDATLLFLGTASMRPSTSRNVSCTAFKVGSEWTIVDCGEGTQHQIIRSGNNSSGSCSCSCSGSGNGVRLAPGSITRILITHLHGDHCFGLPGLLCLIDNNSKTSSSSVTTTSNDKNGTTDQQQQQQPKKKIVQIVGPRGIRNMVRASLIASSTYFASFQIRIDELVMGINSNNTDSSSSSNGDNNNSNNATPSSTTSPLPLRHFSTVFETPPHPCELVPGVDVMPNNVKTNNSDNDDDDCITWTLPPHPNSASGGSGQSQSQSQSQQPMMDYSWTIHAAPLVHSIESVGYVFEELPHRGKVDPTKLPILRSQLLTKENKSYQRTVHGISNPMGLLGKLQQGQSVTIRTNETKSNDNDQNDNEDDGTSLVTIHPSDIMTSPTPGRKVVILGDTCDSRQIARLAANADYIVHEATNAAIEDFETQVEVIRTAIPRGHSTPGMAGTFGKCCGVRQLILTHFSSRYKGDDSAESVAVMNKIVKEAKHALRRGDTTGCDNNEQENDRDDDGDDGVIAAIDFMHVPVRSLRNHNNKDNRQTVVVTDVTPNDAAKQAAEAADGYFRIAGPL